MGKDGVKEFDVTVTISEEHPNLLPNLSAKAYIEVKKLTDVQRLPLMCIYSDKGSKFVDVSDHGFMKKIPIEVIESDREYCYFKKTLPKGCIVFLPETGKS